MATVRRSLSALRDLDAIYDYIAADNPTAAAGVIRRIEKRCSILAGAPLSGQRCVGLPHDLPAELRQSVVGNYVVFYLPVDDGIELYRVLHGARDIPAVFRNEPHEP